MHSFIHAWIHTFKHTYIQARQHQLGILRVILVESKLYDLASWLSPFRCNPTPVIRELSDFFFWRLDKRRYCRHNNRFVVNFFKLTFYVTVLGSLNALLGASFLVIAQCAESTSVAFSLPAGWAITDEGAKRVVLDYSGPHAYGRFKIDSPLELY